MASIKERLIELIEAYAVAKTTANSLLVQLSASALNTFLDAHPLPESGSDDFVTPDLPPSSRPRTSRRSD